MQPHSPERYPDLRKDTPEFAAHREGIHEIGDMAMRLRPQISGILMDARDAVRRKSAPERKEGSLPPLDSIERQEHINCQGLQILFHHLALQVCDQSARNDRVERDLEPVMNLLMHIASTRISIMNFAETKKPVDYRPQVRNVHETSDKLKIPSVLPYLFSPNAVNMHLRRNLGGRKIENAEMLMDLAALYSRDHHMLHSVCVSLATNGMPGEISGILQTRADVLYPNQNKFVSLIQLLQSSNDLAAAHMTGLVESGNTKEALRVGAMLRAKLHESETLAEKYAIALRTNGKFGEAVDFLQQVRDQGLNGKKLSIQYNLAMARFPGVLTPTLDELDEFRRSRGSR